MVDRIQILIADDHRLFREGLHMILDREKEIEVVGEASDGRQTVDLAGSLKPDVALLNITMPVMNGIEVILPIKQRSPKTKPIMLAASQDEDKIFNALRAGAKGYLSKNTSSRDLIKAIHSVHHGDMWVERKLIARYFEREANANFPVTDRENIPNSTFTPREHDILRCLSTGCTNKEIGEALFISEKTVKSHLTRIFRKLNVPGRFQAILNAIQLGLN
jgi:two-component system NarL family response regulator